MESQSAGSSGQTDKSQRGFPVHVIKLILQVIFRTIVEETIETIWTAMERARVGGRAPAKERQRSERDEKRPDGGDKRSDDDAGPSVCCEDSAAARGGEGSGIRSRLTLEHLMSFRDDIVERALRAALPQLSRMLEQMDFSQEGNEDMSGLEEFTAAFALSPRCDEDATAPSAPEDDSDTANRTDTDAKTSPDGESDVADEEASASPEDVRCSKEIRRSEDNAQDVASDESSSTASAISTPDSNASFDSTPSAASSRRNKEYHSAGVNTLPATRPPPRYPPVSPLPGSMYVSLAPAVPFYPTRRPLLTMQGGLHPLYGSVVPPTSTMKRKKAEGEEAAKAEGEGETEAEGEAAGPVRAPRARPRRLRPPTPQSTAAWFGSLHELLRLLQQGEEVDALDTSGMSALHYAAGARNAAAVRLLLRRGADPDVRDLFGATPLHTAAACTRNVHCMQLLLAAGADVLARTRDGCTPLHVAAALGREDAVSFLLDHGADDKVCNVHGHAPADVAPKGRTREMLTGSCCDCKAGADDADGDSSADDVDVVQASRSEPPPPPPGSPRI